MTNFSNKEMLETNLLVRDDYFGSQNLGS